MKSVSPKTIENCSSLTVSIVFIDTIQEDLFPNNEAAINCRLYFAALDMLFFFKCLVTLTEKQSTNNKLLLFYLEEI